MDVQDNRLEIEVVGWGKGKESWGIEHKIIIGNPTQKDVWNQLDIYLNKKFSFKDNYKLGIACTCVDSGYLADEVYKFVKPREIKRIFAVKGMGGAGKPFISRPSTSNRLKVNLFSLGVDNGKETIVSNLKIKEAGPGYCHFPINPERNYNADYFKGLTSEKRIIKYDKGRITITWIKKPGITRNEPFDLRNYNQAAIEILNPDFDYLASKPKNNIYEQKSNNEKPKVRRRRVISRGVR